MTLRDWRESAGLTQTDLARLARVSRASISHIENGRYAPTARFAGRISGALSNALKVRLRTWDIFPGEFTRLNLEAQ